MARLSTAAPGGGGTVAVPVPGWLAPRAMTTPWMDVVLVGGASIALFLVWLALGLDVGSRLTLQRFYFINFIVNAPHFMASYKLLYGERDKRHDYPGVALWTPILLAAWSILGLATYREHRVILEALFGASVVSLSWHYTGQVWGMMASFAFISGAPFSRRERLLVRTNLWTLTAFHIAWAVIVMRRIFEPQSASEVGRMLLTLEQGSALYRGIGVLAAASAVLGIVGLASYVRRHRRVPDLRILVPWIAVHTWYVMLYQEPGALLWVQNAHSLQYLIFPMRVELNRYGIAHPQPSRAALGWHTVLYFAILIGVGWLVLEGLPKLAERQGGALGLVGLPLPLTIVSFVNLHHYFIDGVIWKIRNPGVRRDLFGHLGAA